MNNANNKLCKLNKSIWYGCSHNLAKQMGTGNKKKYTKIINNFKKDVRSLKG